MLVWFESAQPVRALITDNPSIVFQPTRSSSSSSRHLRYPLFYMAADAGAWAFSSILLKADQYATKPNYEGKLAIRQINSHTNHLQTNALHTMYRNEFYETRFLLLNFSYAA